MTLADALTALWRAGAFDAEPGPVRHAWAYVDGLQRAGALEAEVARESPMLVGALTCLLRHVTGDPHASTFYEYGRWVLRWDSCEMYGATEIDALTGELLDRAEAMRREAP